MARSRSHALSLALNAQLFSHLAAMERAGVPVTQALASLSLPARADGALAALRKRVAGGSDMASAGLRSGLFSPLDSSLIYAAQASGCLAQTYARLAERYRHKAQQAALLKSRLLLPAAVLILALFIQPLPALVGGQLSLLGYLWLCLRPLLLLGVAYGLGRQLYQRHRQNPQGRSSLLAGLLRQVPVLGPAYLQRNVRDFFESLGLMLEAGLPLLDALPKACEALSDARLRSQFASLQGLVQGGRSLAQGIATLDFPGQALARGLINSGEASGTLPASLLNYADTQSQKLANLQESLATWLPRLLYAGVLLWMAYGLVTGGGIGPQLPAELH